MIERVAYQSEEGQRIQADPHVSLRPSDNYPGLWIIKLNWREDTKDATIDAEFKIMDQLTASEGYYLSIIFAKTHNFLATRYDKGEMKILYRPILPTTPNEHEWLQTLIKSDSIQRFPTH